MRISDWSSDVCSSDLGSSMKSLTDKTALVTGGGSGIGRSLVLALARAGARIVVADIMLDNARAVADHVEKSGGRAIAVHCDVCDAVSLKALTRASDAAFGPVSLLRSEERRGGKGGVSTCRDGWAPYLVK